MPKHSLWARAAVLFAWVLPALAIAGPSRIDVFVERPTSLQNQVALEQRGIAVHVHALDAVTRLQQAMSEGLPTQSDQAQQEVFRRLQEQPDWSTQIGQAWQGRLLASQYRLTRLPAVVIDGDANHVVYGTLDPGRAIQTWLQRR
ncbi:MAG: TIGR03757 family integrating conjugative element protein [Gammaproteobacteria bacterium]|nr:TIGR03757 family integrating conjugative element protein [Gammaproteobacteria bacterium]MCP5135386.1 TIGR03757 family integrating conjugative element protein [Gammaproteobacteria bacterium]